MVSAITNRKPIHAKDCNTTYFQNASHDFLDVGFDCPIA